MKPIRRKPLSEEIRESLYSLIDQLLKKGIKRLPGEVELSKQLNVSRAALREVLKEMKNEGSIISTHGKPTYINTNFQKMKVTLNPSIEFESAIKKLGYKSSVKVVSLLERDVTKSEMESLRLDIETTIVEVKKIFYANNIPVIFCKDMFLKSYLGDKKYTKEDLKESTFEFLLDNANLILVHDIADISAVNRKSLQGFEKVNYLDKPLLLLSSVYFTARNKPAVLVESAFDTEYINLSILRRLDVYKKE